MTYEGRRPGAPQPAPQIDRGRGYRRVGDTGVEVYDLDLAAWFDLNGLPIQDAVKVGRETILTFYDPELKAKDLAISWLTSQASQFASRVRQIKKIVYSTGHERVSHPGRPR